MENLEPHTHTRLRSPRSIRILKLLPSVKQNAPIQCRLAELDIDRYTYHDYKPRDLMKRSRTFGARGVVRYPLNVMVKLFSSQKTATVLYSAYDVGFGVELCGLILFASIRRKANHRRKSALYKYNSWVKYIV